MKNDLVDLIGNYGTDVEVSAVTTVRIYFDGGAKPTNPGNAYGSYEVECKEVLQWNQKTNRQQFGIGTSNQAEYLSLIAALKWLSHKTDGKGVHLKIFSDSKLVVMQVQGSWKIRCITMRELCQQSQQLLSRFETFTIHWISRNHNVNRFGH